MPELRFEFDWIDADGVRGPELYATWASLKIVAGDTVVTRILDDRAKTVRDFVYVPLYPLAEWFATNWWFIANEFQNREKQIDPEFLGRHSLTAGREGYAFPDLRVFSSGSATKLVWSRYAPEWTRVEFLNQGTLWIDSSMFLDTCGDLIESVVRRLASNGIENTLLQDEWDAIQATEIDRDELRFCETVAALGLDPYDLQTSQSDEIIRWASQLGELLDEAVQVVNPTMLSEQASAILSAAEESKRNGLRLKTLRNFSVNFDLATTKGAPWRVGYDWARGLRSSLDLDGLPISTMSQLAAVLGENETVVDEATKPVQLLAKTPMVDGLTAYNDDQSTSFALRQLNERGRRFSFCRAMAEVILHPWSDALITDSSSERQQRNRAFAAEFLAPSNSLKAKVTRQLVDDEEIADLADEFGVSSLVVKHQIQNHQIAEIAEPAFN